MKILLGIDASPVACETIATVQRMFGGTGASVVVLSVVGSNEPETVTSPVRLASVAQNLMELEADQVRTHEGIAIRAAQALREAGLEAIGEVHCGDPGHVLVSAAGSHAVELIVVVGSHSRSAARRLMLGSVATYVVNHAPCDVLVVSHRRSETGV